MDGMLISRMARSRYHIDELFPQESGGATVADIYATRVLAQRMNQSRDLLHHPEQSIRPGELSAMGLMNEIFHFVSALYRQQLAPNLWTDAIRTVQSQIGAPALTSVLVAFVDQFPPAAVYHSEMSSQEYLERSIGGRPNSELALEELVMLWVANRNPALKPFSELIDDGRLQQETKYTDVLDSLHRFFDTQPPFGPDSQNVIDMLRSPAIAVPNSIRGQLDYIRRHWAYLLGPLLERLLRSLDYLREEARTSFQGPGPALVLSYASLEGEPERFSRDKDWMPRLVLIAKNIYVWLGQLSEKYRRPIRHLDDIPFEELDKLAGWGISGLWLIGVWRRSPASARIKQLMGNAEALASAYSLENYAIAEDLGGEEALRNLKERAWQRGIRLATDMVPNHMGIDSRWVIDHPDWFISLDHPPFPSYSYNGPDLSPDPAVNIQIEDHYYDHTDAAVTFRLYDRRNGTTRYIYHGNDGTSMPWNDTAQLNYLNPEVREAVVQTILNVAKRSPVIRFDAAMTLTKRHYQRLWFPEPGTGGAIPSRSEYGLSKTQFDAAMPEEFWRQVVDRVAAEAPDTLLLAEAFWLMEGYFVRTLGMHRVYNSAFMNMLRDEENANYRSVMKNTLEFDPEILGRFVNFMNNPDERTAVDQFGKGDKYFGICTMMVTLPGLPMFGHGQIEGFSEKYGMEFRRAYWNEPEDEDLVGRHQREIFPLLHRRALFAGSENFALYDLFTQDGKVDEDVFAYSNRIGDERALVLYHNRYKETTGWIRDSVARAEKTADGNKQLARHNLGECLALHNAKDCFVVFRSQLEDLEYIRPCRELFEKGLYMHLGAYQRQVFLDFYEVSDNAEGFYRQVCAELQGKGTQSVASLVSAKVLQKVQDPFRRMFESAYLNALLEYTGTLIEKGTHSVSIPSWVAEREGLAAGLGRGEIIAAAEARMRSLLEGVASLTGRPPETERILSSLRSNLQTVFDLCQHGKDYAQALATIGQLEPELDVERRLILLAWAFLRPLGILHGPENDAQHVLAVIDEWQLQPIIMRAFADILGDEAASAEATAALRAVLALDDQPAREESKTATVSGWVIQPEIRSFLGIHSFEAKVWLNEERLEELAQWYLIVAAITGSAETRSAGALAEELTFRSEQMHELIRAAKDAGYQLEGILSKLERSAAEGD